LGDYGDYIHLLNIWFWLVIISIRTVCLGNYSLAFFVGKEKEGKSPWRDVEDFLDWNEKTKFSVRRKASWMI